jgi:hypothetical protein
MEFLTKAFNWIATEGGIYFAVLFAISEALGGIKAIKENSVYQVIMDGLKFLKDKFFAAKAQKAE